MEVSTKLRARAERGRDTREAQLFLCKYRPWPNAEVAQHRACRVGGRGNKLVHSSNRLRRGGPQLQPDAGRRRELYEIDDLRDGRVVTAESIVTDMNVVFEWINAPDVKTEVLNTDAVTL